MDTATPASAAPPSPAVAAQAAAVAAAVQAAQPAAPAAPAAAPSPAAPATGVPPASAAQPAPSDKNPAQPAAFDIAKWAPKLPDGVQPLDQKKLSAVHGIVFNDKLSAEQKMQALVDFQVQSGAEQQKALDSIIAQQRDKDFELLKADPTFGGARLDQTVKEARDVMTYAFGEKGSKLLEAYGLDKHPDVVIPLARIRAVLSEDTIKGTVKAPAADPNSPEAQMAKMFPKSNDAMQALRPKR